METTSVSQKPHRRLALSKKISIVAMAGVLICTLLVTLVALQVVKQKMLEGIERDHQSQLATIGTSLDEAVEGRKLLLKTLAQSIPAEYLNNPDRLQNHLRKQQALKESFDTIALARPDGVIVANYTGDAPLGKSIADREYFQETVSAGSGTFSKPLRNRFNSRAQVILTEPVEDQAGNLVYVIAAGINLHDHGLLGNLASVRFGKSGYLLVVNSGGTIIEHPEKSRILSKVGEREPKNVAVMQAVAGFEGNTQGTNTSGVKMLYTFQRIKSSDWILGAAIPMDEVFAPITEVQHKALVPGLMLALLMGLLAALLARHEIRPLVTLHQCMVDAREDGEFEVSTKTYRDDEIGDLGHAFAELLRSRKATQTQLSEEKERLRVTLRSIGDAVITADNAGNITYLNLVAERMTGWRNEEAIGLPVTEVFKIVLDGPGTPAACPVGLVLRSGAEAALEEDTILISRTGVRFPIEDSAAPILDEARRMTGVVLVFHDVTHARQMAARMSYQAKHDALTGLINRREFEIRLTRALISGRDQHKQHTLLYLDLDQFKVVNDTSGHAAGDELLRQLTQLMQAKLRKSDTLARLGGDEFGVLLEDCATDAALRVAETVRQAVSNFRFVWHDKAFTVGASIGLVAFSNGGVTLEEILKSADAACYLAKDHGRNRIHVYNPDDHEVTRREGEMTWVSRIRKALEEDRFVLYAQDIEPLQPKKREAAHREILLRLRSETGEIVPPMAFIPAAERYGLMNVVDRWVCERAIRIQAQQKWLGVSAINLSGTSASDKNFMEFLRQQFTKYGANPADFCFEITETAAIANLSEAARLMRELKDLGCKIALDDFGSGMSSFGYLKQLPVDYLKIDGSIVRNIASDGIDHAMVEAIHRIGHVMGLRTIAEFVQDVRSMNLLSDIGVDFAQGYAVARPKPIEDQKTTEGTTPRPVMA